MLSFSSAVSRRGALDRIQPDGWKAEMEFMY